MLCNVTVISVPVYIIVYSKLVLLVELGLNYSLLLLHLLSVDYIQDKVEKLSENIIYEDNLREITLWMTTFRVVSQRS